MTTSNNTTSARRYGQSLGKIRSIVTPAMPKTRTGKIMRRLMREVLLYGEARSDTSALEDPGSLDVLAAAVREHVA